MILRAKLMTTVAMALAATALTATAYAQDAKSLAEPGKDWETFHGSYKSWNYSPLNQINTDNVGKLKVAFIQQVGRSTRGLETTPLAKDGILYYSGSYSKVFAVNGATGEMLWSFIPKLDEDTVTRQTHSPYNRGLAMGFGNLYVGTVDGRLIAIDIKTGKPVWDTKLVNSQELSRRGGQAHHDPRLMSCS
jgi:alcohol dehydrogenase (cytochrome c)